MCYIYNLLLKKGWQNSHKEDKKDHKMEVGKKIVKFWDCENKNSINHRFSMSLQS